MHRSKASFLSFRKFVLLPAALTADFSQRTVTLSPDAAGRTRNSEIPPTIKTVKSAIVKGSSRELTGDSPCFTRPTSDAVKFMSFFKKNSQRLG